MGIRNLVDNVRHSFQQDGTSQTVRARRRPRLFPEVLEARTLLTGVISIPLLPSPPTGLATVIPYDGSDAEPVSEKDFKKDLATISAPYISGVAFQINWRDIEPDGPAPSFKPKWSRLDQVFQAADAAGKWVQLLIMPGFWSPKWIFAKSSGVVYHPFHPQYGRGSKGSGKLPLPMPWDTTYLTDWNDFLQLVEKKYGGDSQFRMIAAAGPTSVSDEFTEPDPPKNVTWSDYGYSLQIYENAWQTIFSDYATDFPKQYVSLSHGNGISDPDQTRQDLLTEASTTLGARFSYQSMLLPETCRITRRPFLR